MHNYEIWRRKIPMGKLKVPGVATLAINVKGADLLFLDHLDSGELGEHDHNMWLAAVVNIEKRPFGRVIVYTPLKEDGFNRYSLRSNPEADIPGYSETREFALGIQDIWPYLGMFFDKTSTGASALIAEVDLQLKETHKDGFALVDVLNLFEREINKPKNERKNTPWEDFFFADELNRLAPRDGNGGIGEYLAQLARTTRDRGIVLFGAGQFRSGINEDILKAASVHYSMRTPEHELSDRIYAPLSPEIKAQLTQLEPGQTLLQYPALRTAVFARFPRPFVMSGARAWQELFPPVEDRPLADCIFERLCRLDSQRPPLLSVVRMSLESLLQDQDEQKKQDIQKDLINVLRDVEVRYASSDTRREATPWQTFFQIITGRYPTEAMAVDIAMTPTPQNFAEGSDKEWE